MHSCRGLSLAEVLVVVAVIGILAAIAVPRITSLNRPVQQQVGLAAVERLNRAVLLHLQAVGTIDIEADAGTADEVAVLELLQTAHPLAPGTPLIDPALQHDTTSDIERMRAYWNGQQFQLLVPGQVGAGLDLDARLGENLHSPTVEEELPPE